MQAATKPKLASSGDYTRFPPANAERIEAQNKLTRYRRDIMAYQSLDAFKDPQADGHDGIVAELQRLHDAVAELFAQFPELKAAEPVTALLTQAELRLVQLRQDIDALQGCKAYKAHGGKARREVMHKLHGMYDTLHELFKRNPELRNADDLARLNFMGVK